MMPLCYCPSFAGSGAGKTTLLQQVPDNRPGLRVAMRGYDPVVRKHVLHREAKA